MKIIKDEKITLKELTKMSEKMFDGIVKAVVDIEREIMVVDAAMHADQEKLLLDDGSSQNNLWGINFHPNDGEEFIEFDSMINIRPSWGNRTRGVDSPEIQKKIKEVVSKLVAQ